MKTLIISVALCALSLVGSITFLIAEGKDATQLITFVTPYVTLALPVLLNLKNQIEQKATLNRVDHNVNGHLTSALKAAGIPPADESDDTPKHVK